MSTEVDNILQILVRDEQTWLNMAEEISNSSKVPAKDLLHDFYIALHSKIDSGKVKINDILYNDSLNKAFIYKMMHNIFIDNISIPYIWHNKYFFFVKCFYIRFHMFIHR